MPLTDEQRHKIAETQEALPARLRRNPLTDYTEGVFHITLNVRERYTVLGELVPPSASPSAPPSASPSAPPSVPPSASPSAPPSAPPSVPPSASPSVPPSASPSASPSAPPSASPSASPSAPPSETTAKAIRLTRTGRAVETCWCQIPTFYPSVELLAHQVMPEHFHGLLRLKPARTKAGRPVHLGNIVNGFMAGCTHGYWDALGIPWREQTDAIAFKEKEYRQHFQDRDHTRSFRGPGLFVHGYNDVEALTEAEVAIKIAYIHSNVERRLLKQAMPDIFRPHRGCASPGWTTARILQGLRRDRFIGRDSRTLEAAFQAVQPLLLLSPSSPAPAGTAPSSPAPAGTAPPAPASAGTASAAPPSSPAPAAAPLLDWLGERTLLSAPRKVSLICHRADAALFDQQAAAVLAAARDGAVVVTASISPRERSIVKQLQQEFLPVVEVMAEGFGERYKPTGQAFYACAEHRRVELSPWRAASIPADSPVTREMCMVMNELVRLISGCDDDWWKH